MLDNQQMADIDMSKILAALSCGSCSPPHFPATTTRTASPVHRAVYTPSRSPLRTTTSANRALVPTTPQGSLSNAESGPIRPLSRSRSPVDPAHFPFQLPFIPTDTAHGQADPFVVGNTDGGEASEKQREPWKKSRRVIVISADGQEFWTTKAVLDISSDHLQSLSILSLEGNGISSNSHRSAKRIPPVTVTPKRPHHASLHITIHTLHEASAISHFLELCPISHHRLPKHLDLFILEELDKALSVAEYLHSERIRTALSDALGRRARVAPYDVFVIAARRDDEILAQRAINAMEKDVALGFDTDRWDEADFQGERARSYLLQLLHIRDLYRERHRSRKVHSPLRSFNSPPSSISRRRGVVSTPHSPLSARTDRQASTTSPLRSNRTGNVTNKYQTPTKTLNPMPPVTPARLSPLDNRYSYARLHPPRTPPNPTHSFSIASVSSRLLLSLNKTEDDMERFKVFKAGREDVKAQRIESGDGLEE